jgi:apolipoprotein N-acyltransferase
VKLLSWLLAPLAGALFAVPFAAREAPLAAWLALAPLLVLLGAARRPFLTGSLHGVGFWLASVYWIAGTLVTFGNVARPLAWLLVLGLAAYLALYTAVFATVGRRLWQAGGWPCWLGLPALWVVLEGVRGWVFTGFPWNLAAYAWTGFPGALPAAAWIGPWGVSFLVVFANLGVARAVVARRWEPLALGWLVPLAFLAMAGRWSTPADELTALGAGSPARIVQPNVATGIDYDPVESWNGYVRLITESKAACDAPGALVVWPESAAWPHRLGGGPPLDDDVQALADRGCPVLLNSTTEEAGRYFNSAFLVRSGAEPARYDKRHLVPFGEYVPLRGIFGFLDRLARNAGDYSAADEVRLLPWGAQKLGVAICFEVTFPTAVAELSRQGATALVTITNDSWYGDTSAPWQHFRSAQWRAAENRRPLLRAAITGVSGSVGPDGSVRGTLGVGEQGVLRTTVVGRTDLTPFARNPRLPLALAAILAAVAIVFAARRKP